VNIGDDLTKQGKYTEAIQMYQQASALAPQWTDPWYHTGAALKAQKRYDEAIGAFNKVNELNPKDGVVAWYHIGRTLSEAGRYAEAIQAYSKSTQAFNTYGEWWQGQKNICAQSWYYEGIALNALGHTTEANAAFDKARELGYTAAPPANTGNLADICKATCAQAGYQGWTGQMQGSSCMCASTSGDSYGSSYEQAPVPQWLPRSYG
jgi:tetratricopeptide (TPR) repeat protein